MNHLGTIPVKKLTILLMVVVPQKQSPPRYCKIVINQSELKFLQLSFSSMSSITQKKSVLNSSQCVNDYYRFESPRSTVSRRQKRILWASSWICYNFFIRLSWAVSNKQKDGTALGYKYKIRGKENQAKGTTRITEQGMNLSKSMITRFTFDNSQPVNSNLDLVLYRLRIHLAQDHRSLDPCAMVYFISLRKNFVLSQSVFSWSTYSFALSSSIFLCSNNPQVFLKVIRLRTGNAFLNIPCTLTLNQITIIKFKM